MPSHGPTIGFRLPLHDHEDLLALCEKGESAAACAKRIVLDALHGHGPLTGAPAKRSVKRSAEITRGPERMKAKWTGTGILRERGED